MLNRTLVACLAALVLLPTRGPAAPAPENACRVSWGDHIVIFQKTARLDTPEKIRAAVPLWRKNLDARHLFWRVSGISLERDYVRYSKSISRYWEVTRRIFSQFDPAKVAIDAAHANGMKIYAWLCIYDEGCPSSVLYAHVTPFPWQSKFTIAHPEYLVLDRTQKGRHWGVMEYAYPEARRYKVEQFKWFLDTYDFDGVYVCTRSHSPPAQQADRYGFNDPIVAEYQRRHHVNILEQDFDKKKWRRLRGEYLTQLFRDLRAGLPRDKAIIAAIPRGRHIGPPYGNMYLDWETWVREGIVDGLAIGVITGKFLYRKEKLTDQEKGYLSSQQANIGMRTEEEDVNGFYGPLCQERGKMLFLTHSGYGPAGREMLRWRGLTGLMLPGASAACFVPSARVADHAALAFADARFTMDLWLKWRRHTDAPRLVSKYNHELPDNRGRGWEVMLVEKGQVHFRLNDGQRDFTVTSQTIVPKGKWVHVACVCEGAGGKLRIYIDGKLDPATAAAASRLRPGPVPLHIGEYANGTGARRFEGLIDHVRLSRGALTFDAPPAAAAPPAQDTVALWTFDEPSGAVFLNAAGDASLNGSFSGDPNAARAQSQPGSGRAFDCARP